MKVIEIDPSDRAPGRLFLELPFKIYKDMPQWVPPLETSTPGECSTAAAIPFMSIRRPLFSWR